MPSRSETSTENPTRELAAIMFSDVVGYTAIMGRDEAAAMRALDAHRQMLRTLLPRFNGRLVGEIGDGTLSSFRSAMDAVNCAREVQAVAQDDPELRLRIGIHLGDVVFTNNTVIGDGVNVASRIHALAPPGGICISAGVYDEIRNKPGIAPKDLGEQKLKNVSRPIRVYALVLNGTRVAPSIPWIRGAKGRASAMVAGVLALAAIVYVTTRSRLLAPVGTLQRAAPRQIRSIAVLPLDNFSGDPGQEYFADGMTDELTTDLANISALRVISRGSVMQYKGAHRPPSPEIAKALNVDAVIEGSVIREGDRVRITAQLIDAPADKHLWAKSYERNSRDVLALQDEIASEIAREVNVQLTPSEQVRLTTAPTVNPAAHDAYLKGRYFLSSFTEEGVSKAIEQFEQSIKLDPSFPLPYTGLADAYSYGDDWYFPANEVMPKAKAAVEKALQLDDSLAEAHASLAFIKWQYDFDWVGGESEYHRAFALNPNYADAHHQFGYLLAFRGRFDESLAEMKRASELDPLSAGITNDVAFPLTLQARYEAAKEQFRKALELDPNFYLAHWALGWADIEAGNLSEAIAEIEKSRVVDSPPFIAGWLGYAYAAAGERDKAEAMIAELDQTSSRRFVSPFCTAIVYLGLGDKQRHWTDWRRPMRCAPSG
jgi:adenylate cyclase